MTTITFEHSATVARAYLVLAHLDLGRDAASVFDPRLPARPWVPRLLAAYRSAPGRLALHGLPLLHPGPELLDRLREGAPPFADTEGRRLTSLFADALEDLADEPVTFAAPPHDIVEPLTILRAASWEVFGPPPRLRIFDAPALRRAGRATWVDRERVVAVGLDAPDEHVLCQIFHEEVHAVTDPAIAPRSHRRARDTRTDSPGFFLHRELELAAVEAGQAIVDARLPAWSPAYARWRASVGM